MRPEMPQFQPRDPNYAERVRASFGLQHAMTLIGAEMALVEPGYVEIFKPMWQLEACTLTLWTL